MLGRDQNAEKKIKSLCSQLQTLMFGSVVVSQLQLHIFSCLGNHFRRHSCSHIGRHCVIATPTPLRVINQNILLSKDKSSNLISRSTLFTDFTLSSKRQKEII